MSVTDLLPNTASFSHLPLRKELLESLDSLHYESMTPIQRHSLPLSLAAHDVIAQAQTGSGKTTAFGLPILNDLKISFFGAQSLILCPTRELAEQVSTNLRRLACFIANVKIINLSGGIPMKPQLDSLRHGAHIIVGTPGRILKHLNNGSLVLAQIRHLVLDEADRMLDMGFFDDIQTIISYCPKQRQTLLFSATYSQEVKTIAQQFMINPQQVVVEAPPTQHVIEQRFYEVGKAANKLPVLNSILAHYKPASALIFCNTKQQTIEVTDYLIHAGWSAIALNGDMEQVERDLAMIRFINQSCSFLVATDVAARGLDIQELPAVINFDLAFEHDVHLHRIGRTGRAGKQGLALSITVPADAQRLCLIEEQLNQALHWEKTDSLISTMTAPAKSEMVTLSLAAGKKEKIRAGDILGALTKDAGLPGTSIGKINIGALYSYVAIHRTLADKAFNYLKTGTLKGRRINVRKVE